MDKEKPRSFRLSKETMFKDTVFTDMTEKNWWKIRKPSKTEYRNTASLCIGLGIFVMPILLPVGIIAGTIWIYKVIRKQE